MIQDSYLPAVQSPCHGLDADWQWFASRVPCWPQERWPLTEEDWIQAEKVSRLCRGCILCYFSVTKPLPGSNDPMIIQLFTDPSHLQSPRVSVQLDVEPAFVYFHKLTTAAWGLAATERLRKENARKLTSTGCEAGACRSGWRTGFCVVLAYLRFLEFFALQICSCWTRTNLSLRRSSEAFTEQFLALRLPCLQWQRSRTTWLLE